MLLSIRNVDEVRPTNQPEAQARDLYDQPGSLAQRRKDPSLALRAGLKFVLLVGLLPAGLTVEAAAGETSAPADMTRPNVVLVMTDDQGFGDLGLHGNEKIVTPNIDQFGREGIQFTRFYVSPVCAPTRASLMTGRYHYRTGVIHTSRGGAKMFGDEVTVAEILAKGGYQTGIFGKWHLGDNYPMRPQDQGFAESLVHRSGGIGQTPDKPDSYLNSKLWHNGHEVKADGYCTDVFFQATLDFIEQNRDEQFFAYVPLNAPHTPLEISDDYVKPYLARGLDETTARVYGMVQNIDENFAKLLAKLDELKLRDNTLVIFLTDNGAQQQRFNAGLRGRKSHVYEGGIRVPCFFQWPARLKGKQKIDRVAAHIDLLPTIVAACLGNKALYGEPAKGHPKLDGMSLLPLIEGKWQRWPLRSLFFQCHRGLTPKQFQNAAVVTQKYKLVCSPGTFGREDFESPGESKFELYDLNADESESKDLSSTRPQVVSRLKAVYEKWFQEVRSTRDFSPGVIHIGAAVQDRIHLCRYQDSTYRGARPIGWPVKVLESSRYEMVVRRGPIEGPLEVSISWQGSVTRQKLKASQNRMSISLAAGDGLLSVALHDAKGGEIVITDNGTSGDVTLFPVR
jgi:arylsulfatase A-like enzyme